jgi:hypothetical protein
MHAQRVGSGRGVGGPDGSVDGDHHQPALRHVGFTVAPGIDSSSLFLGVVRSGFFPSTPCLRLHGGGGARTGLGLGSFSDHAIQFVLFLTSATAGTLILLPARRCYSRRAEAAVLQWKESRREVGGGLPVLGLRPSRIHVVPQHHSVAAAASRLLCTDVAGEHNAQKREIGAFADYRLQARRGRKRHRKFGLTE